MCLAGRALWFSNMSCGRAESREGAGYPRVVAFSHSCLYQAFQFAKEAEHEASLEGQC